MRVIYLDASLLSELGHFAGVCRRITTSLHEAGVETFVFGHSQMDANLRADVNAIPLFRFHPNARLSDDSVSGWLISYFSVVRHTFEDLCRIQGLGSGDLVVYDCARPAQVAALIQWLQSTYRPDGCPRLLVILGWPSGMVVERDDTGKISNWGLQDQSSCLYRLALSDLKPEYSSLIRFGTFDSCAAEAYSHLLSKSVERLPETQQASTSLRDRASVKEPCLAFLGEQRVDKGYTIVPEIVARLLASNVPLRILVQNSWAQMEEQNIALYNMAAIDKRLTIRIGTLNPTEWNQQLAESDMVILPYHLSTYATSLSGIGAEAIANGIPQAVPSSTGMEFLMRDYGMPGVAFSQSEPGSVVSKVLGALDSWPAIAAAASNARALWSDRNTSSHLSRAILGRH